MERGGAIRLHNADGSIVEISGNGTRYAARIAYETKAGPGDDIVLETGAGRRTRRIDNLRALARPALRCCSLLAQASLETRLCLDSDQDGVSDVLESRLLQEFMSRIGKGASGNRPQSGVREPGYPATCRRLDPIWTGSINTV